MWPFKRLAKELELISPTVLIVSIIYIAVALYLFTVFGDQQTKIGSLSSNLFAGSVDTFIVVILISYVIARNARNRNQILRFAAYSDAEQAIRLLRHTWFDMIKAASKEMPAKGDDLLDERYFEMVGDHLDLDQDSGMTGASWLARASATGIRLQAVLQRITSRYSEALSPEIIIKCTKFENSPMITLLASLVAMNSAYLAKGTTMQKPLFLSHFRKDMSDVRMFVALVHEMSQEFKNVKGYSAPVSFIFSPEMEKVSMSELSSARVA
jgi:hypothetical protein